MYAVKRHKIIAIEWKTILGKQTTGNPFLYL